MLDEFVDDLHKFGKVWTSAMHKSIAPLLGFVNQSNLLVEYAGELLDRNQRSVFSKRRFADHWRQEQFAILLEEWKTGAAVVENDDDESKDQSCYEF